MRRLGIILMAVAVSVAYAWAISHAEDEVHVVKKDAAKMYVNHPAVVGHEDNLKLDPDGVWEGFDPKGKVEHADLVWAYVDYQRRLAGVRVDITTEKGTFRTCPLFEVNDVEYLREKNDKRLVVGNHMMTTCGGIEKWIKEELQSD
jgi:hypothetical protein